LTAPLDFTDIRARLNGALQEISWLLERADSEEFVGEVLNALQDTI
jgi:hypothetical protein